MTLRQHRRGLLDNGGMKFLSSFAALFTGRSSSTNDLQLEVVKFDPPDGSTLMAGEKVTVTVKWRHSMRNRGVGIWTKPVAPREVGGGYDSDGGEAHEPGRGRVTRGFHLSAPCVVTGVVLSASDGDSRELFSRRIPVNFTYVVNPEREARRHDGAFSRITGVKVEGDGKGPLPVGSHLDVHVSYFAQSTHGVRVTAVPITDADYRHALPVTLDNGEGEALQGFTIGEACVVQQVRVRILNASDAVVAEEYVDCDLEFGD